MVPTARPTCHHAFDSAEALCQGIEVPLKVYMLGRRFVWLRLRRRRGMCAAGLWTKLHKRRPYTRGLRMARAAAARSGSRAPQKVAMFTDSMGDAEATAPLTAAGTAASSSSPFLSSPTKRAVEVVDVADEAPNADMLDGGQASLTPAPSQKPKRQVVLLPSVFEGRPPVIFFSYTVACGAKQRPMDRAIYCDIDGPRLFYSHTDAVHEYNAVINIMRQGGLYRVKADTQRWLLLWSNHPPPEVLQAMKASQRTNHFPGSWHLGRKDLLWRNISRMQRRHGKSFTITPTGFVLPKAFESWDSMRLRQPDALWIWKPCSQSCGRGIKVFSSAITDDEAKDLGRKRGVIQRYIPNPLLIDGYKFDLRIYVVIVSYDPLKVFINDEGLVRLATQKYSSDPSTLDTRTMHLTNYSVNKLSPAFVQNKDGREETNDDEGEAASAEKEEGNCHASKWSLTELRANFKKRGLDYNATFNRIKDVVIKTLIGVEQSIQDEWCKALEDKEAGWLARGPGGAHSAGTASCFEMYGFDILIDDDLKPWLLEVNICPSLSSGSPLDKRIKTKLVADALTLVGIRPPPSVWKKTRGSVKRPSSDLVGMACDEADSGSRAVPSRDELAKQAAKLAACDNPLDAVAHFDELAWDVVVEAHDQDMRCGGLERIYPTAESSQYVPYLEEESYFNLVLRKWYEAGGGEIFGAGPSAETSQPSRIVPPWVPRKVCFQTT